MCPVGRSVGHQTGRVQTDPSHVTRCRRDVISRDVTGDVIGRRSALHVDAARRRRRFRFRSVRDVIDDGGGRGRLRSTVDG